MRLEFDSQKSIGEMLDELPKSNSRNKHIKESNIIVSTPVFDHIVCSMKTKKTVEFKESSGGTRQGRKVWAKGLEKFQMRGNQLPVEEEDEVCLALLVEMWLSLGRPRVVESTTISRQWLQLQPSQPKLLRNVPTLWMGTKVSSEGKKVRSCHRFC